MPAATDIAEAKLWCSTAREILKKSRIGKNERDRFSESNKQVEKLLVKLLPISQAQYDICEQEYRDIAGEAKKGAENNNRDEVEKASKKLTALVQKIQGQFVLQKELDAGLEKFDAAYTKRETEVAEAAGLRGATTDNSPVKIALEAAQTALDQAHNLRGQAETQRSLVKLSEATTELGKVKLHLKTCSDQAKAADVHAKEYLKAIKEWGHLQPLVRAALTELRSLPGAEDFAEKLQDRYNEALGLIKQTGGLWSGHDQAVQRVSDYEKVLADARKASAELLAKDLPQDVVSALNAVTDELDRHADAAPPYATAAYRDEASRLADLGRSDANTAYDDLTKLAATIKGEADRLETEKQKAETAATNFDNAVQALVTLKVPTSIYAASNRMGELAKEGDLADRQWTSAESRLKSATKELTHIDAAYKKDGQAWEAKRLELRNIHDTAGGLVNFPAVGQEANRIREAAHELLVAFESFDFAANLEAANKASVGRPPKPLSAALQDLVALAKKKGVPDGKDDRQDYLDELRSAMVEVRKSADETRLELQNRIEKLKELTPHQRSRLIAYWQQKATDVEKQFEAWRQAAAGDAKELAREKTKATDGLDKVLRDQKKMKAKEQEKLLEGLTDEANAKYAEELKKWLQDVIDTLTAEGEDLSAEQKKLDDAIQNPPGDLEGLKEQFDERIAAFKQAQEEAQLTAKIDLHDNVEKPLKKLKISERYREELQKDGDDLRSLINSKDPYLLEIANRKQQELAQHIAAIGQDPKLHEKNKERTAAIAHRIGDLIEKLPETHRRLKTALAERIVDSKHCAPSEMTKKIDELEAEVVKAEAAAKDREKEVAKYKELKEKVKKKFDEMKAATHTRVTEKSEAFETYYEARLAEASGHKARETGIPDAMTVLNNLWATLDKIVTAENPRAQLRELDSEQQQDQRLVKDMAAQFERELGVFTSETLPAAKAAAKESEDGDVELVKSLKGVASAAAKIVSPYLKINTTLKMGANPAPDMQQMKHDFERARAMLAEATRTAQRLTATPTTTNVKGPQKEGLRKIQQKWRERTQAYATAVREVAKAMRDAAASEANQQVKANAEKAAKVIEGLAGHFRGEAFATSFAGLMDPLPKEKKDKEKAERKQLAERETALRVMRQYRTDLLKHPLLTRLTDKKKNPFEAPTMMAAAGALRALLKEVELQVLDSVG